MSVEHAARSACRSLKGDGGAFNWRAKRVENLHCRTDRSAGGQTVDGVLPVEDQDANPSLRTAPLKALTWLRLLLCHRHLRCAERDSKQQTQCVTRSHSARPPAGLPVSHAARGVTANGCSSFEAIVCQPRGATLHWQSIDNSIVELAATVPVHYVIADGVEAMESNGPLHGPARHLGCLVFANDPDAADSACCSLMDIDPRCTRHLAKASSLGNLDPSRWELLGDPIASMRQTFRPPPMMTFSRVNATGTFGCLHPAS
ncbi:MAG: DUF362 domain-containing protein [Bryobacteraceae bacterium]|nr:DUF362 domain-containing protein [Bryobacteraceae bacterium]